MGSKIFIRKKEEDLYAVYSSDQNEELKSDLLIYI